MAEQFPAPRPITAEERQFIATVEKTLRPAFLRAVAGEFGPAGRPADEVADRMAAAPVGERLQTAVEARMDSGPHFDTLPAQERSAVAQQAALASAETISQLSVQTPDGRLGELAGNGLDRVLQGQYAELAHAAAGRAGAVLGGGINRARFIALAEVQRQAGAGLTPPTARNRTEAATGNAATERPAVRAKNDRQPHVGD
jgi:hypothetical protein